MPPQNNFSVSKAYFSDYSKSSPTTSSSANGLVGMLGMSVGISFMFGPIIGGTMVENFEQGLTVAAFLTVLSGAALLMVPNLTVPPPTSEGKKNDDEPKTSPKPFLDLTPLQSPGPRMIISLRVLMSLSFHVFMTPWTPSLKSRFDFGPKDHGNFMSFVGLVYALSQGLVAKQVVRRVQSKVVILVVSSAVLSLGRVLASTTEDLRVVYACFGGIIMSLGVANTVISTTLNTLAPPESIGGLIGLVSSVESMAGMFGPVIGGWVFEHGGRTGTLGVVCGCYAGVAALTLRGWRKWCEGYEGGIKRGKVKGE